MLWSLSNDHLCFLHCCASTLARLSPPARSSLPSRLSTPPSSDAALLFRTGIVIVYPRLQPHGGTAETQGGCWDAYGQTGADYARRTGVQMAAIAKMIATIAGVSM